MHTDVMPEEGSPRFVPDFALPDLEMRPSRPVPPSRDFRVTIALKNEVKNQCFRARRAANLLDTLVSAEYLPYDVDRPQGLEEAALTYMTDVWSHIHTILSAAGIVSRILFPKPPPADRGTRGTGSPGTARARAAVTRAEEIWRTWPLPAVQELRPLSDPSTRNAIEHIENGAPEWFSKRETFPLLGFAIGRTPEPGNSSGGKDAFRFFFEDRRRVKVGDTSCSLSDILRSLKIIEDSVPTSGSFAMVRPMPWPYRLLPDSTTVQLNACPIRRWGSP
jgi:hypothetical protein